MCVSSIAFCNLQTIYTYCENNTFFKNWKIKVEFTPPKLTAVNILENFHSVFLYLHRVILNAGFVFVLIINVGQLHD